MGQVFATDKVDINTASLAQLDTLTGIGPKYAQAIINARPFSSVDDLDRVKGIGPKTLQKIKTQGLACVNCGNSPASAQTPTPTPVPTPVVVYPSGVIINEILPNPAGADETMEWVELYNSNNSDVDLSGWQLQDKAGTITTYAIPSVTKILADNFLVFKRPDTKIMLNNDKDGLNLVTPDGKIVDSVSFVSAPLNQSYNKKSESWAWSATLTPGAINVITALQTTKTSSPKALSALPKTQKSANNSNINSKDLTAGLSQTIPTEANPWPLFIIVLTAATILGVIVLIIKLRFLKPNT